VDRDHFARVLGLSDMVMALNRALGPAVSGFAISYGGSEFACAVSAALCYLGAAIMFFTTSSTSWGTRGEEKRKRS